MKLQKLAGATSEIWQIFIRDSSSTTGGGLTGLTNASGSLTAYYHRDTDTTATVIALVSMTVGTFTSSGFKEIDATNMPGWYQFCPPNAALASGAKSCGIHLKGASNMAPTPIEVQLMAISLDDAVRMGMTALPNAAAEAAGGLFTRGTGAGQINQDGNGRVDANVKTWISGAIPAVNVTGVPIVDDKYLLGTVYSTPATAGIADINVINWKGSAAPAMTGDAFARLGAPAGASVSADVAAVKAVLPTALVSGRIDASVGAMAANVLTATAINADAITAAKVADGTIDAATFAAGAINAAAIATDAIDADALAADAVAEIQSGLSSLSAAGVRSAIGLASANLDTQLDALPTNAELATALASADDATLAAIAALNNLSAAQVNAEADTALADYDGPTHAEMTAELATADDATLAAIAALTIPNAAANAAAVLAAAFEGAETVQDFLRLSRAALYGVGVNLDTSSPKYKSKDAAKNRIIVTGADSDGNRPVVTLDAT